jgi:adenine-specific DNA-methyltransferase
MRVDRIPQHKPRASSRIEVADAFQKVKHIKSDSVQLVLSSPPYNVGKSYEKRVNLDDYLYPYREYSKELFRVVGARGSVCWQVGNFTSDGEVFPLDILFYGIFKDAGFTLKNRVIWHFRHGLHAQRRLSGRYETILWFSKGADPKFNLDSIRVPALYPGKLAFKGPKRGLPTGNPLGKNPSDLWPDIVLEEWESGIWDIPNVKANHPEKSIHPCQFPVELAERCILAFTDESDLVVDPFLGVGSTAIAAQRLNRSFRGFELDPDYANEARDRLAQSRRGTLPVRQIGQRVPKPQGKVSLVPPIDLVG